MKVLTGAVVLFVVVLSLICGAHGDGNVVFFGTNLPMAARRHVESMLVSVDASIQVQPSSDSACYSADLCLSFGNTTISAKAISAKTLQGLGREGMAVSVSGSVVAANGNVGYAGVADDTPLISIGAAYATYTAMNLLGFHFMHPLNPILPPSLVAPKEVTIAEAPHWAYRSWHYHTEHPLELNEVLNGFDAQALFATDPSGNKGFTPSDPSYYESWESMLPQVDLLFQWLIAHRQNRLEWLPLWGASWVDPMSALRQSRLRTLTTMAHEWGLLVAPDAAIAERQQHGWYMTNATGTLASQTASIAYHLDWFMAAGFDYLSTESGFSEFSHPSCDLMLELMNFTSNYLWTTYKKQTFIKAHCSTGQTCPDYANPVTGASAIDFNFLPVYASDTMGIMPHTVQLYNLDGDPAPTYGNTNYEYMAQFMFWVAKNQQGRNVVWHPETTYWVNYDIDVPLALPVYGQRRVDDLRYIASQEAQGVKIDGQNVFSSGWAYGYWLSDIAAMRGAWDPQSEASSLDDAFAATLAPVAAAFGNVGDQVVNIMVDLAAAEKDLLIDGIVDGVAPSTIDKRNGIAYLEGFDTWSELETFTGVDPTQPARISPTSISNSSDPSYPEVAKLLAAMDAQFSSSLSLLEALEGSVPAQARASFLELLDSVNITAARAKFVRSIYAAKAAADQAWRLQQLAAAMDQLQASQEIATRRQAAWYFPVERVAGWRTNPTVYTYGYLWTAQTRYYSWRDFHRVNDTVVNGHLSWGLWTPCYGNIDDPIDVIDGETWLNNLAKWVRRLFGHDGLALLTDCLGAPLSPPNPAATPSAKSHK